MPRETTPDHDHAHDWRLALTRRDLLGRRGKGFGPIGLARVLAEGE